MGNIKAIIIEDELQAVNALKQEIQDNCPSISILGTADTIETGYDLIINSNPDLVFLDIRLKDGLSFEILKKLDNYSFNIIFTTAYSEYALQAIKVSALDYLLKPIDSVELVKAIEKLPLQNQEQTQNKIQNLLFNQTQSHIKKKIAIQTSKGISFIEIENIIRLQSEGNYTNFFLKNSKNIIVAKTLKEFEEVTKDLGFVRIHHSHIININYVENYVTKDGGFVELIDRTTLPVSKRKKNDLLEAVKTYFN